MVGSGSALTEVSDCCNSIGYLSYKSKLLSNATTGKNCKYVHALPPGFILKSKKDKTEKKEEITLEQFLETEVRINLMLFSFV